MAGVRRVERQVRQRRRLAWKSWLLPVPTVKRANARWGVSSAGSPPSGKSTGLIPTRKDACRRSSSTAVEAPWSWWHSLRGAARWERAQVHRSALTPTTIVRTNPVALAQSKKMPENAVFTHRSCSAVRDPSSRTLRNSPPGRTSTVTFSSPLAADMHALAVWSDFSSPESCSASKQVRDAGMPSFQGHTFSVRAASLGAVAGGASSVARLPLAAGTVLIPP